MQNRERSSALKLLSHVNKTKKKQEAYETDPLLDNTITTAVSTFLCLTKVVAINHQIACYTIKSKLPYSCFTSVATSNFNSVLLHVHLFSCYVNFETSAPNKPQMTLNATWL